MRAAARLALCLVAGCACRSPELQDSKVVSEDTARPCLDETSPGPDCLDACRAEFALPDDADVDGCVAQTADLFGGNWKLSVAYTLSEMCPEPLR